jgi:FAD/FMN-containing dehydrogenase
MGNNQSISESALEEYDAAFRAKLVRPGEDNYDTVRLIHNGMIDKRPALIACCTGVSDVVDAIKLGVDSGLEISVRGGGHNVAGRAVCDDGLMIDLSNMKGIYVDPQARTVRAQAGVTWNELNLETQLHGLATTGGMVSSTGVAGLTLGGGIGWLMGKYGLAIDTLLSVELVTAAGDVLQASENENIDLFWGLRGGGGNFGVATSFEFSLFDVGPTVIGGLVVYPFDQAREVLKFYRDFTADIPDELSVLGGLIHAPDGSGTPMAAILACHCGTLKEAEAAVEPIKAFGNPAMVQLGPMPYSKVNAMLDDGFPKGALNYWKSSFLSTITDDAIDSMIAQFSACPSGMSGMIFEQLHGVATSIRPEDTAFPHRGTGYNLLIASVWLETADTDSNIAWTRETYDVLEQFMHNVSYVNYLGDDETIDRIKSSYGVNFDRLQKLKTRYDPDNVFHLNHNIVPG